ncbi:MAG: hypothetical protein OHK0038_24230 [Flammeovirgaceae bacterium]
MMKFLIVFIFLNILFFVPFIHAQKQNVDFIEANFSKKKKGLKSALRHLKIGYGVLEIDENEANALKSFHRANKFNPNNSALNYQIGKCYLEQENPDLKLAIQYLEYAKNLSPIADIKIHLDLAKAYHLSMQWENAITQYNTYKKLLGGNIKPQEINDLEKKINECESGKILAHTPKRADIEHLGKQFNTRFYESSPVVSADEKFLMFNARRNKSTGYEISEDGTYFEDVYIATKGKGGNWAKVEKLKGVNSNGHDAIVSIAPNGKRVILYKGIQNGDLFAGTLEKSKILDIRPLPDVFNTKFKESSACINSENNLVYFTSNRPNSVGGLDIWLSQKDSSGVWQEAKNCGNIINSPFDEDGVCLSPDGKTLYFSSKGHNSIGGYDIFKSTLRESEWSKPENLGIPINTPFDDIFVSVSQDGKRIYFSSYRSDSYGSYDLYMATLLGEPKEPELVKGDYLTSQEAIKLSLYTANEDNLLLTNDLTLVKGKVIDPETGKPLSAQIIVSDNEKEKLVAKVDSNPKTGEFEVILPIGSNYGIAIKSEGRLLYSENIDTRYKEDKKIELTPFKKQTNLPDNKPVELTTNEDNLLKEKEKVTINEKPKEVFLEVKPEKIAEGSSVRLNNIFFDVNKAELRKESISELNHIVEMMKEYPNMVVEVAGHTDNTGTAEHNMALSTERARSVLKYLISKGIDKKRIVAVGYGMSKPIASNDTEEGRQSNRRTEFKILKMK